VAISIVGVGAVASGTASITPPLPVETLQIDDVLIGIAESVGGEIYPSMPPSGWQHVLGSPINVDTSTRLTVIWRRWTTGVGASSWGDPGNHAVGRIIAIRGVKATGNPWNVTPATAQETAANTSADFPSVTTTVDGCRIVFCIATGRDLATTANLGVLVNGTLTSIAEQMDNWIALGTGGGIGMVTAIQATAGALGTSTATMGSTDSKALMTIALEPAAGGVVGAVTATTTSGSTVAGVKGAVGAVTATTTAGSTVTGSVGGGAPVGEVTSTVTAGSTVTATVNRAGAVTATTTTTSTVTASVGRLGAVTATTTAGSTVTATSAGKVGAVTSTVTSSSTVTGVIGRVGAVTATTTSTSTVTGSTVSGLIGAVTSTTTAGSTVTAVVTRLGAVTSTTTSGSTVTAVVTRFGAVTATTTAGGTRTAVVGRSGAVTATTTTTSTIDGVRAATGAVATTITAGSTVTGAVISGLSAAVTATTTAGSTVTAVVTIAPTVGGGRLTLTPAGSGAVAFTGPRGSTALVPAGSGTIST
jgi:hypothetical protein